MDWFKKYYYNNYDLIFRLRYLFPSHSSVPFHASIKSVKSSFKNGRKALVVQVSSI